MKERERVSSLERRESQFCKEGRGHKLAAIPSSSFAFLLYPDHFFAFQPFPSFHFSPPPPVELESLFFDLSEGEKGREKVQFSSFLGEVLAVNKTFSPSSQTDIGNCFAFQEKSFSLSFISIFLGREGMESKKAQLISGGLKLLSS